MDGLNLGFIGGCINNQKGIAGEDLYHSVLSKLLNDKGINFQLSLGGYVAYNQMYSQTVLFINRKQPRLLYLFIRPFPLMPLHKPLVKYDTADKKTAYTLHPALFNRKAEWGEELTKHQAINEYQFVKRSILSLRDINLLAGTVLGLHNWALKYICVQLDAVKLYCAQKGIKLTLISTPKNPESFAANLVCKWTTDYLVSYCRANQIEFININSFSLANFGQDKLHFNEQGHRKLGELIYTRLKEHLEPIPNNTHLQATASQI